MNVYTLHVTRRSKKTISDTIPIVVLSVRMGYINKLPDLSIGSHKFTAKHKLSWQHIRSRVANKRFIDAVAIDDPYGTPEDYNVGHEKFMTMAKSMARVSGEETFDMFAQNPNLALKLLDEAGFSRHSVTSNNYEHTRNSVKPTKVFRSY